MASQAVGSRIPSRRIVRGAAAVLATVALIMGSPGPADTPPRTNASLENIRELLAADRPLTVSVLGDSTGDEPGEWVDLWAAHLAQSHIVTVNTWSGGRWEISPPTGSTGPPVTLWNGSQAGATGAYALGNFGLVQPERPGLIIYNLGHNYSSPGITADIMKLQRRAERGRDIPFAVTLQNPAIGDRGQQSSASAAFLRPWATGADIPLIDVESAFARAPVPLSALLLDGLHPNDAGSLLWADTVVRTLG